ncbi:hypothetical protein HW555_012550 [Spodoptera exigua]|uniref:Uncharacterized protein n=1 Tax=Spodoptera exigua TaxID=7107 RepID=A0A835G4Y8_SPOEX|nr:hypothetical protein HW555_012550 [Spodoptera exigua]
MAHGSLLPGKPLAMDVEVITAAAIYLYTVYKYYRSVYRHKVIKKKWRKRRWWMLTIHRNRTRVFKRPIPLDVVKTSIITHSCLLLHNFLRKSKSSRNIYTPPGSTDSYDRNGELIRVGMRVNHEENLLPLQSVPRRPPINATQIRSNFMNYIHQSRLCSAPKQEFAGSLQCDSMHHSPENIYTMACDGPRFAMHNCRPRSLGVHTMAHGSLLPGKPLAMDVEVITAAAIYLYTVYKYYRSVYRHKVIKKKWRKRRWWMLTIHRNRTRVFKRPIPLDVVKTSIITHSCLLLHNFLRKSKSSRNIYTPPGSTDSYDRNGELIRVGMRVNHEENLLPLQSVPRRPPINATQIRSNFMNYIHQSRLCSGRAYDA